MGKEKHKYDESFYHFAWQHKLYNIQNLQTTDGLPIEVIHSGLLNKDAGPDFFNAKIKIDNVLWAGNIEIHIDSKDWELHHHKENKAYDNVILHVVTQYNSPAIRSNGSIIPTMVMDVLPSVYEQYETLQKEKDAIACHEYINTIDKIEWINYYDRLITERLQNKSISINQKLEQTNNDWENVFFQTLCRNFGFGVNADIFERLSTTISYKIIAKHRNSITQLEALLLGQAGFLDEDIDDDYHKKLKAEYKFLKAKYELTSLEKHNWKFMRLRPVNFPTIRLAQLAYLLHNNDNIAHSIIEMGTDKLEKIFKSETSVYWCNHYNFGKESSYKIKKVGKTAIQLILINTVVPFLFCYGKNKDLDKYYEKAIEILENVPAERNHITTKWEEAGLTSKNACDSQALIQLYTAYCQHKKCIHCKIGYRLLSLRQ